MTSPSKSPAPSWTYPAAAAAAAVGTREAVAQTRRGPAGAPPPSADDFVAYARHVWARDRASAVRYLLEALRLDPGHPRANQGLADYFFDTGMLSEALDHSARAVEGAPDDPEIAALRLLVLEASGMTDEANRLLARHFDAGRTSPALVMMFAKLAPRAKREAEAVGRLEATLAASGLPLSPPERKALHMHAAALLDRTGRYDEAFDHARRGHAANPPNYDPHAFRREMDEQVRWYTRDRLDSLPRATHGWTQPVFIVGMPRSGTSLVEQILDRHPAACGAGELLDLNNVLRQAAWPVGGTRAFLERATSAELDAAAGLYISRVASFAPHARYITDKLPFNWMRLGAVSRLFPEARVIHVVRDPRDTCLSCYLTHFNDSVNHASDLTHLGMHYVDQARMMAHWRGVLDLPILDVSYEALVAEPESQVRRLLEFLELPWDERCVRFHESDRFVTTASMHQVHRPLYRSSVGRWANYRRHLQPLVDALDDVIRVPAASQA